MVCLFNWDDAPQTRVVRLESGATVVDYWTDQSQAHRDGNLSIEMPPRSARVLKVTQ